MINWEIIVPKIIDRYDQKWMETEPQASSLSIGPWQKKKKKKNLEKKTR